MDLDIIVIGGGPAGEAAGFRGPELDARVAVVERDLLGGECPFWACLPSKTLLNSAMLRHAGADYPWQRASDRRDWMISREGTDYPSDAGHVKRMEAAGTRVVRGDGRLVASGRVEVRSEGGVLETLEATSVIIAAGSTPFVPPIDGLDRVSFWTSRDATSTRELPSSLVILGGGVVGVELGQAFLRFGTKVTIVEGSERVLSRDHPLSSKAVAEQLAIEGAELRTGVSAVGVRAGGAGRIVELSDGTSVEGAELLVAVGRRPADLRALGVESAGVDLDDRGRPVVDAELRIAPGIYVAGDVAGGLQFTHLADHEGGKAVEAALGRRPTLDLRAVPKATFTDPETGAVGMTVQEAKEAGIDAFEVSRDWAASGKGQTYEDPHGHMTAVIDRERGILAGAFAACPGATELIHEASLALKLNVPVSVLADTIHAFPTSAKVFEGVFKEGAKQLT